MRKAIGLLTAGLVGLLVGLSATQMVSASPVDEVTVFNSGFSDSKLDDCQQGFLPACEWLNGGVGK